MKNNLLIGACAAVLAVLGGILIAMTPEPSETVMTHSYQRCYNWYVMNGTGGQQPVAADDALFKDNYRIAYMGDAAEKKIWLTFDLGYDNGNTELILDALKEKDVEGAFFICGHVVETCPELVKRMAEEGHAVCNHTEHHADLSGLSEEEISAEMTELEEKYTALTGRKMDKMMRPPEGKYSESSLEKLNNLGYTPVFWSFAYKDWIDDDQPTEQAAIEKILSNAHPGMVALLHSTSATNAKILPEVIDRLRDKGYAFGTMDELRALANER
ncbi:MAG: polysaccharide deacetylase family protein [Christensenellaceae bacterium]|nr:polysaccharide deacetylase family protein [Christensenellaceae bacterium]